MFYLMIQTAILMLIAMLIGGALVWYFCCRRRAQDKVGQRPNGDSQSSTSTSAYAAAAPVAAAPVASEPEEEEVTPAAAPVVEASSNASDSGIVELSITATADEKDDLQRIYGIGPKLEKLLNSMGVYTFEQIANFTEQDIARVDARLEAFKGRIVRDNWMKSARELLDRGNA